MMLLLLMLTRQCACSCKELEKVCSQLRKHSAGIKSVPRQPLDMSDPGRRCYCSPGSLQYGDWLAEAQQGIGYQIYTNSNGPLAKQLWYQNDPALGFKGA